MPKTQLLSDDPYKDASQKLDAAINAYRTNPNVENLIAVYEAQNAVRQAANTAGAAKVANKPVDPKTIQKQISQLQDPMNEPVPGAGLGMAQALLDQIRFQQAQAATIGQTTALGDAQRQIEAYIQTATARIQDDDNQFEDEYMRLTGQPAPPGRFNSGQTINGTPTPTPSSGEAPKDQMAQVHQFRSDTGKPTGWQLTNSPSWGMEKPREKPPKRQSSSQESSGIYVEPLPDYAPYQAKQGYKAGGLDVTPEGVVSPDELDKFDFNRVGSDSVKNADAQIRAAGDFQSGQGLFQAGHWFGNNRDAVKSGQLVFTGWQTRATKYIDEYNPRLGTQIVNNRTPTYQAVAGLQYALGKPGYPTIAEFQKKMGLPVTGDLDDKTMSYWQGVVGEAAMNTAGNRNMTVQMAMDNQLKRAQWAASQARAAMAAAYNVDPTASAAILGSAMKQITGRLSTPAEDSEFHRAFNSANISTQGKVDAQQFARDWVRNKYPTEAGTMAGQDYYGAMFDVLTSGPGSLGSEAADING